MKQYRKMETDESKKTIKRTMILMSVLILIGIVTLLGASYALFSTTLLGEKKVSIQTGTFQVEMKDGEYIKEEPRGTMTDKEGKKTKPYTFTITNASTETIGAYYKLYLTEESGNLNTYYLKYELKGNDGSQKEGRIGTLSSFYINKYLEAKESITYELRLWLDEETPNSEQGKNYQSKIAVEGNQVEKIYTGVETLLTNFTNEESVEFDTKNKDNPVNHKMFVFHHEAGTQQDGWSEEELTDYRYIGENPNNYVTFNGEKAGWRIIGIFTVENEKGEKEKRIKLIRSTLIDSLSWDNKNNGEGTAEDANGYGSNNWSDSRLMMLLNEGYQDNPLAIGGSLYWNRESGLCPGGAKGGTKSCDFTNTGLTKEAQVMIGDTKWYLGGRTDSEAIPSQFYKDERGTETCQTTGKCKTERQTYWKGKVGLMYPSDYGYATSGGSTTNREGCLAKEMNSWNGQAVSDCKNNDWLFNSSTQWTMSPRSNYSNLVFDVYVTGGVYGSYAYYANSGRPVVYLVSDILCSRGTGSQEDPFVFEI